MSKLVIEVVKEGMNGSSDLTYEDGLLRIANKAPKVGIELFSEEVLLRHADSVIEQVRTLTYIKYTSSTEAKSLSFSVAEGLESPQRPLNLI